MFTEGLVVHQVRASGVARKKIVADLALDIDMLKELAEGNF